MGYTSGSQGKTWRSEIGSHGTGNIGELCGAECEGGVAAFIVIGVKRLDGGECCP